eukprot:3815096-Alexandrium_andersonii.AAC.1
MEGLWPEDCDLMKEVFRAIVARADRTGERGELAGLWWALLMDSFEGSAMFCRGGRVAPMDLPQDGHDLAKR